MKTKQGIKHEDNGHKVEVRAPIAATDLLSKVVINCGGCKGLAQEWGGT